MEGIEEPVSETGKQFESSKQSEGSASKWPIVLVVLALGLTVFLAALREFPSLIIFQNTSYYLYIMMTYIPPVLYIFGVIFMYSDKSKGKHEIIKLSTVGGITLIMSLISSLPTYNEYFSILSISNRFDLLGTDIYSIYYFQTILATISIIAAIIGSYFALTKRSLKGALLASGLSIFLFGGALLPLAIVPIALSADDFPKIEKANITEEGLRI
jgi:hypothetical protein